MEWFEYLPSILSGLAITIPLVIKLVEYVLRAYRERNWQKLINLLMQYMIIAEENFETGAERKEWVISMIMRSADTIDYPLDEELISKMIDSLCDMTKKVNPPTEKESIGD